MRGRGAEDMGLIGALALLMSRIEEALVCCRVLPVLTPPQRNFHNQCTNSTRGLTMVLLHEGRDNPILLTQGWQSQPSSVPPGRQLTIAAAFAEHPWF